MLHAIATNAQPASASQVTASPWNEQEQSRFGIWLEKHPADVLIVPFQVSGYALDPVERALMAARLADALASQTSLTLADPMIADRALGEGLRTLDESEIFSLANRLRARYIVIGLTGHDGQSTWRLNIRVLQKDSPNGTWRETGRKAWDSLPLKNDQPPHQAIPALAQDVLSLLGAKAAVDSRRAPQVSIAAPGELPTLKEALAGNDRSINIHLAQLLAACNPRTPEAGAERAWMRTLRLAYSARDSAGASLPIARALMHLGRRPAALAALGSPRNDAEHALREVLNGNLPAATRYTAKIADPVMRLIAQVELRDMRQAYGAATSKMEADALSQLLAMDSDWYPFLRLRVVSEGSHWEVEDLATALLRFGAPVGLIHTLMLNLQGAAAAAAKGEDTTIELARAALTTYDAEVKAEQRSPQDNSAALRWLALDLFQTQVVADLLAETQATIATRDAPDAGHTLLADLDPILRGHPDFEAIRARLAWREYARWRGQQRAHWQQLAIARTRDAYTLAGRVTNAIEDAERNAAYTPEIAAALDPLRIESFWNWPGDITWIPAALREDRRAMQRYAHTVTDYTTVEFANIGWLMDQSSLADLRPELEKSVANRFDGSPELVERRASSLLAAQNTKAAEEVFRGYVSARPMAFGPYYRYLDLLVSQGRHAEGFRMFSSHPGFDENSSADRVELSNYAAFAGLYFWPIGKFEYAEPLLAKSADYNTGSAMSMRSAALMALYRGNPDRAARIYMQDARRYSDLHALDEYFKLIFALGRKDEAWLIYKEVYNDGNGGRVLATIARQARITGMTDQQILDWLAAPENARLADGTFFYAPRAALSAAIIDRDATVDLAAIVRRFPAPSPYAVDKAAGKIVRRADAAAVPRQQPVICGPSRYGGGPAGGMSKVTRVDSGLLYFANGYRALARQQYADAFAVLDEAARLLEPYGTECESVSYMLPYLAIAAGQTRNVAALREYLEDVPYRDRNLNYNLVLAVLAALDSKHRDAQVYLDAALNRWTSNPSQTLPPEYIYADILERLYTLTKEPAYRDRLVQWVRIRERVAPSDAWAFAKEYRYAPRATDRAAALGIALYLDPHSATLSGVSAEEASAAKAALGARNFFVARNE